MKFGICCGPTSLGSEGEKLSSAVARLSDAMQTAGADYVEFGVAAVHPAGDRAKFEELREAVASSALRVEAFNSFIPAHHRITGPEVDLESALGYCRSALLRCRELGGAVVVLGSSGARKVPPGFDIEQAEKQFIRFCRALAPLAEEAGIDIALEPLNAREDNLLISVEHGAKLVDEIKQPRIRLLADLYHMAEEGEPMAHVAQAGARLRHTHLADRGRVAPGYAPDGEEDFIGFFRALRQAGYDRVPDARCSFEGSFNDMASQLKPALDLLKRRWQESGGE